MKLETIETMWSEDSRIDETQLDKEVLAASQLHAKYYQIFLKERLRLRQLEIELKELSALRTDFYTGTLDEETLREQNWLEEFRKFSIKVLKADVQKYLDKDKFIIKKTIEVAYQKEKTLFLESIIDNIKFRGNHIRTAVDYLKFTNGF